MEEEKVGYVDASIIQDAERLAQIKGNMTCQKQTAKAASHPTFYRIIASLQIFVSMCIVHVLPMTRETDNNPEFHTLLAILAGGIFTTGILLLIKTR